MKPAVFAGTAAFIALGLMATTQPIAQAQTPPDRATQCSNLIAVANRAVSSVQEITRGSSNSNAEDMIKIADAADQASSEMQALQLTDTQLQDYQARFLEMYSGTSQATRDLADASNSGDSDRAQEAFNALVTATDKEGPLVNDVNQYCQVK